MASHYDHASNSRGLVVGEQGTLVISAEACAKLGWGPGTRMVLTEADTGAALMSVDQARALLKAQLGGRSLADELIAERHAEAAADAAEAAAWQRG